jgi:DNA-directed RNA polymerase specialized sigma24 family protein
MIRGDVAGEFEMFVIEVEPGLRRALSGHMPSDRVPDALSEAFTYAWEHWDRVNAMANPSGYLFRVAQSRSRSRRHGLLERPVPPETPSVEPGLVEAVRSLSAQQRSVVWLVHGCGWRYGEVSAALDISISAVGTHLTRAMARLREQLGVMAHE